MTQSWVGDPEAVSTDHAILIKCYWDPQAGDAQARGHILLVTSILVVCHALREYDPDLQVSLCDVAINNTSNPRILRVYTYIISTV